MDNPRGFLADLSGVMLNDGFASLERYEKRYGIREGELQRAKNGLWVKRFRIDPAMSSFEFWKECFLQSGTNPTEEQITEINRDVLESHYPHEAMFDLVRRLKDQGIRTGLLTNTSREWFEHYDRKFGLSEMFPVMVTSYELGIAKPDPRIFLESQKKIGLRPEDVLYLDDQERNIEAGMRSGYANSLLFNSEEYVIPRVLRFFGVKA